MVSDGIATAVEAVVGREVEPPQGELFGPPAPVERKPGKGGRPAGATNKRTRDWLDRVERLIDAGRYGDPVEFLLSQLAGDFYGVVEEMARRLCCDRLEAAKLVIAMADKAAPYVRQKRPLAVQMPDGGGLFLSIMGGGAGGDRDDGAFPMVIEENADETTG